MTNKQNNTVGQIIPGIIGFIIGAVFGLVVLGWWLWPVTWTDATPAVLSPSSSQDYLRAAIDSYMLNQDADLAQQRYQALGEQGASTLAAIYSNPLNQTAEAIQAYAAAVDAGAVLQNPPGVPTAAVVNTPAPESTPGAATTSPAASGGLTRWLWQGALACLAILLFMGLIFFLFNRSRKRTRSRPAEKTGRAPREESALEPLLTQAPAGPAMAFPLPTEPDERATVRLAEEAEASAAAGGESGLEPGELPDWLQGAPSIPVEPEASSAPAAAVEAEIPDWLQEAAPPPAAPAPAEEEFPDWLKETAPPPPAQPAAAPGFIEEPDWLAETVVTPPTPAPAVQPAWEPDETKEQTHAKFSQNLEGLPAMDPEFARRLRTAGVGVPLLLLKKGATLAARQELAGRAGVDLAELTTWVNVVDLFRVRGVTGEHALLLDGVGIHGVPELAAADPDQLTQSMAVTNQEYNLLEQTPDRAVTANWIEQAKKLPKAVA